MRFAYCALRTGISATRQINPCLVEQAMPFPPNKDPTHGFSPEALEDIRRRYVETDETQTSIGLDHGRSRKTISNLAIDMGWPLRKDRPPRGLPPALKLYRQATEALAQQASPDAPKTGDENAAADDAPPPGSVAARLEAEVEKQLRAVESLRSEFSRPEQRSIEAERIARTLATLTETLFKVRRLREAGSAESTDDDDLPSDVDGFRRALAHRIEAFVRSRMDGSVPATDQPSDAESPAS
jgi:hypothetical protein